LLDLLDAGSRKEHAGLGSKEEEYACISKSVRAPRRSQG
jgi:hypothetical protein